DPLEDVKARFTFLSRHLSPLAILIDDLDRCRAEYVVELLEGMQTLFVGSRGADEPKARDESRPRRASVAYIVAGEQAWICDSYLHVYSEFAETAKEPGRPFGYVFLERAFDL